jgi:hypothetical protein
VAAADFADHRLLIIPLLSLLGLLVASPDFLVFERK